MLDRVITCSGYFTTNITSIFLTSKGDHHVVSTILSAGAEINTRDADGNTALLFASRGAYLPCMALLIVSLP